MCYPDLCSMEPIEGLSCARKRSAHTRGHRSADIQRNVAVPMVETTHVVPVVLSQGKRKEARLRSSAYYRRTRRRQEQDLVRSCARQRLSSTGRRNAGKQHRRLWCFRSCFSPTNKVLREFRRPPGRHDIRTVDTDHQSLGAGNRLANCIARSFSFDWLSTTCRCDLYVVDGHYLTPVTRTSNLGAGGKSFCSCSQSRVANNIG